MGILDKLKKAVNAGYHGISPFDNGQGWTSTPPPKRPPAPTPPPGQPAQPHPSFWSRVGHDITHNPVTNVVGNDIVKPVYHFATPAVHLVGSLANTGYHVATIVPEEARAITGFATGNRAAGEAAFNRAGKGINDLVSFARGIPRAAYQLGESVNPAGGDVYDRSHTPTGRIEQFLLGKDPINSMQKQYKETSQTSGKATAAGEAFLTSVMDALGGKQIGEASFKAGTKTVKTAADNIEANANDYALNHPSTQAALSHIKQQQVMYDQAPNIAAKARISKSITQNTTALRDGINTLKTEFKQGGYVKVPGNKEPAPVEPVPTPAPKPAVEPGAVKVTTPTVRNRSLINRVFNDPNTPLPVKQKLINMDTSYTSKPNAVLLRQARDLIGKNYDEARRIATTEPSDRGVAVAGELIKLHQARGETLLATDLANSAAKIQTELGRGVQAASLWSRVDPVGIVKYAARQAQKSGRELTPDISKQLEVMAKDVQQMADGEPKAIAVKNMLDLARAQDPSSFGQRLITTWKAGLLTSPITHAGNILSNVVETGTRQALVNPTATAYDMLTSIFTGKRSRALTIKGTGSGAVEGVSRARTFLKTGYDPRDVLSKYDMTNKVNFGTGKLGRAAEAYTQGVFRVLGAPDQPFYYANLHNSLVDRAITEAKNAGLKGTERDAFVHKFLDEPPTEALQGAVEDAWRSVWGNETILGNIAAKAKQPFNFKVGNKEVKYSGTIGNFVIPFTRVPAAIATRIVERSPIGFVQAANEIVNAMRGKGFDQRAFTEKMANATVGTTGAVVVGKILADHGAITLGYPTDPKERALWEREGKQAYSVNLGGRWYSLNYIQPFGSILAYGAAYNEARKNGASMTGAISTAAGEATKAVTGQSFLKGLSGALGAIQDPSRQAEQFVQQTAGSIVPNIIQRANASLDPNQRITEGVTGALKSDLPFLRQSLPVKKDLFGAPEKRPSSAIESFLNPLKPSDAKNTNDKPTQELQRLYDTLGGSNAPHFGPPTTVTVNGQKINLSKSAVAMLAETSGPLIHKGITNLLANPDYQKLDDQGKADQINRVIDIARKEAATKNAKTLIEGKQTDEHGLLNTIGAYASAFKTSPLTAFNRIFTGQRILRTTNGAIIVERLPLSKSEAIKAQQGGDNANMKLDHTVPLELGGSNGMDNLKLVTTDQWKSYTPVENALGSALKSKKVNATQATKLIKDFKGGNINAAQVFDQLGLDSKGQPKVSTKSKTSTPTASDVANIGKTVTSTGSSSSTTDSAKTPKDRYDAALKDYNDNKSDLSVIQRATKEHDLKRLKVASGYSQDTVDLYHWSKERISDYVTTHKDGQKLANELKAYDQALYDAGLTKYLKFKNGVTSSGKGGKGKGSKTKFVLPQFPKGSSTYASLSRLVNEAKVKRSSRIPVTNVRLRA